MFLQPRAAWAWALLAPALLLAPAAPAQPPAPRVPLQHLRVPALDVDTARDSNEAFTLRCGTGPLWSVEVSNAFTHSGSCSRKNLNREVEVREGNIHWWLRLGLRLSTEYQLARSAPELELVCEGNTAQVRVDALPVALLARRLTDDVRMPVQHPSLTQALEQRLSRPPRGQPREAEALRTFLPELLTPDPRTQRLVDVNAQREAFASGDWRPVGRADSLWKEEAGPRELHDAMRRWVGEVKQARERSQPWRAVEPHRVGEVQWPSRMPPFRDTTLFWRGTSLCVPQTDATPDEGASSPTLRCLDPVKRQWKQAPASPEPAPRMLYWNEYGCSAICSEAGVCVPPEERAVGGIPDQGILSRQEGRWVLTSRGMKERTLSAAAVNAELARGPGGPVLGEGRFLLTGEGDGFVPLDASDRRKWYLLEAPPPEGQWLSAVVSPDQRWVAVLSGPSHVPTSVHPSTVQLWVARLVPVSSSSGAPSP